MFGLPKISNLTRELRKLNPKLVRSQALIGGEWRSTEKVLSVTHPGNGEHLIDIANCGAVETTEAIHSARAAFPHWAGKTAKERAVVIQKWGALMEESKEDLAKLITLENGKPFAESMAEMGYAISFCDWFAHEARRLSGDTYPSPWSNQRIMTIKQPIGVVGMITPWNFPVAMITRKAAPALSVGCPVVLKPSEDTPLTALAVAQLALDAGLPADCFHVLPSCRENTVEVGRILCESPKVSAISFTGSTAVGEILLRQSASTVKKVSLELGGLGPFIVFPSADLDAAADGLMSAKFRNAGQACIAANIVLVHKDIESDFIRILLEKMKFLKFGDPFSDATCGPIINQRGLEKIEEQVTNAVHGGATVHCGGGVVDQFHFEPTLISNVDSDALCITNETFGPICAIKSFESEEEALALSNRSDVGLAGYFYSRDVTQCFRVAEKLEVGIVGINSGVVSCCEGAFGGVKKSGLGREGGLVGLDEFTEIKYMCFGGM